MKNKIIKTLIYIKIKKKFIFFNIFIFWTKYFISNNWFYYCFRFNSLTVSLVCSSSFVLSSLIPLIGSSLMDFCLFKLLLLFNIKINILIKS